MNLPPDEFALYKPLYQKLMDYVPFHEDTMWVTIDSFGSIVEHDDDIFTDIGFWFCHGTSRLTKMAEGVYLPASVWHLLKRRV